MYFHSGSFLKRTTRSFHPRLQCGAGLDTSRRTPPLEKAAGECEQAGHLGGLLDKELLSACPHLRHQAAKEAVGVRRDSLPLWTRPHAAGRTGPPSKAEPDGCAARTTGGDTGDGKQQRRSRSCLSCDRCGHVSPQRIVPETTRENMGLILQLTSSFQTTLTAWSHWDEDHWTGTERVVVGDGCLTGWTGCSGREKLSYGC